jgi:hypothetical protein
MKRFYRNDLNCTKQKSWTTHKAVEKRQHTEYPRQNKLSIIELVSNSAASFSIKGFCDPSFSVFPEFSDFPQRVVKLISKQVNL